MSFIYEIDLPNFVIKTDGAAGVNASEQLLGLLAQHTLIERMKPQLSCNSRQSTVQAHTDFVCNLPEGIFSAHSLSGHQKLMDHIHRLLNYGLLNMPSFWQAHGTAALPAMAASGHVTPAAKPMITLSPPALMNAQVRHEVIADFKRLVKEKYVAGTPLTLQDGLAAYCRFKNRKPSKDELSRVRIVAKDLDDPYLHELTRELLGIYENNQIARIGARTIEERMALVKRIYQTLIEKHAYRCSNPLANWKPSISARVRKQRAADGIASMERVCTVFGSPEFAKFGQSHRAFYLIVMTAVVTGMRITSICRLKAFDLITTLDGTPIIDVNVDKTGAGKRQVPIPASLHTALKTYLHTHRKFPVADRGKDKGCSDAISKLYEEFLEHNPGFNLKGMNPHGLRASLNDYLGKAKIPFDIRCALIGHKNQHVNSVSYSTPLTADLIAQSVSTLQEQLLTALKFDRHAQADQGLLI